MNIQQSYRESSARGASPVDLVVRLYEQIVEDLRQAAIAIDQNDIRRRTKRINHAILVIGHLQSPLDFDNGGKVAQDLDTFLQHSAPESGAGAVLILRNAASPS